MYRKTMSAADDHGRYEADPTVLRGRLYPRRLADVTDQDIEGWLAECCEAGLIRLYRVGDATYLQIENFRQRIRTASRFPEPKGHWLRSDDGHLSDTCLPQANANAESNTEYFDDSAAVSGSRNKLSAKFRAGTAEASQPRPVTPSGAAPPGGREKRKRAASANGQHSPEELAMFRRAVQAELGPQASEAEIERRFSELVSPRRPA